MNKTYPGFALLLLACGLSLYYTQLMPPPPSELINTRELHRRVKALNLKSNSQKGLEVVRWNRARDGGSVELHLASHPHLEYADTFEMVFSFGFGFGRDDEKIEETPEDDYPITYEINYQDDDSETVVQVELEHQKYHTLFQQLRTLKEDKDYHFKDFLKAMENI